MTRYLKELLRRKDLLLYLVKSGLKAEHRNSYLGYFWWLLDPLLGALVYYFLVVIVMGRGGENYGIYLVIGQVVWRWTNTSINNSSRSIIQYTSIIQQVNLPKAIFPLTRVASQLVNFMFGLIVVVVFLLFFHIPPHWQIAYLPIVILVQLLFLMAISLIIAYVSVFIRDLSNILSHFMRVWFYASPVIWEGSRLPYQYEWIEKINPLSYILKGYRDIFISGTSPNLEILMVIGLVSVVVVACLIYFYSRNEHKIIKAL
ncbi:ABC transporter permease [Paenibacillus sp. ACRRY]|uniref:ABC transporter permease n=1 Tax=Paenibacillus sp. ACRRY TaxID=2918208 RepID=UPI001EF48250|nr:ABC transporter permease [Paenibacillus sp. ACRRY]MCG7384148.1 ABC transporter permease [Paenibacillus sp. ACRRY]